MKINVELDEKELRKLVLEKLKNETNLPLVEEDIEIQVKSKQNYKSEWEDARFRAIVNKYIA